MREYTIGLVGGMGSYATVDIFKRIVDAFPAQKEWERPRIIIDNRCTMPSRVRAILYNEKVDEVEEKLSESVRNMIGMGCDYVILGCNTSHYFYDNIIRRTPEAKGKLLNIIKMCADEVSINENIDKVFLIASEGTLITRIFDDCFANNGIDIVVPKEEDYPVIRNFIESVKQNNIDQELNNFETYVKQIPLEYIILGCTELPVLYEKTDFININKKFIDPIDIAISYLKREYLKGYNNE